jgi:hypothetical protein
MRSAWLLLTAGLLLFVGACVALTPPHWPQPSTIVVRNVSPMDLEHVVVSEINTNNSDNAARLGRISPVPRGVSQSVGRSSSAAPLPASVLVSWQVRGGEAFSQRVSLDEVLRQGHGGETLVFEFTDTRHLKVYLSETPKGEDSLAR